MGYAPHPGCFSQPPWMLFPSLARVMMINPGGDMTVKVPPGVSTGVLAHALSGELEVPAAARTLGTCLFDYMLHLLSTVDVAQLPLMHHQFAGLIGSALYNNKKVSCACVHAVCRGGGSLVCVCADPPGPLARSWVCVSLLQSATVDRAVLDRYLTAALMTLRTKTEGFSR